jgi:hypothetical protein
VQRLDPWSGRCAFRRSGDPGSGAALAPAPAPVYRRRMWRIPVGIAVGAGLLSCHAPAPKPAQNQPEPDTAGCQVRLRVEIRESGPLRAVRVFADNLTDAELSFELPERCPNGLVDFSGLGARYDYYGTCNAGACAGWPPVRRITLGRRSAQLLAEAAINVQGKAPCTSALAPGRYTLRPLLPQCDVRMCVAAATLAVPAPAVGSAPAFDPANPYACQAPADCVLSCPDARGCCGWACGCSHAINVHHRAAFEAGYPQTCARVPNCPAMGCSYEPAIAATCRNGRCVGVKQLSEL